jgi:hypothetical protein
MTVPGGSNRGWEAKVDHRLRALLGPVQVQPGPGEVRRPVSVFIRFRGDAAALRARGVSVRSVAGDVATATIDLLDIPGVASAPEIVFVELSRPLRPDPPGR